MAEFAKDYVDVAARLRIFKEKYPDGSLQPVDPAEPIRVVTVGDRTFLAYTAAAYRTPDDARPGIGVGWEPFPGKTSFTRDSEAMNAETSAWGRAIVAALAADTKVSIATAEDVRNRRDEGPPPSHRQHAKYGVLLGQIQTAADQAAIAAIGQEVTAALKANLISQTQRDKLGREAGARLADIEGTAPGEAA